MDYKETFAKLFDKENPFVLGLFDGTKYVLNAPGKDWNLNFSFSTSVICGKRRNLILTKLPAIKFLLKSK